MKNLERRFLLVDVSVLPEVFLKVLKAKELLADETLSIDAIAEMVGYKDYFYFTKVFKKTEGISPSKYRKSIRG